MTEDLHGHGNVRNKKTGEAVASGILYFLRVSHPSEHKRGHIDADIRLGGSLAQTLIIAGDLLTLQLEDGREVDFWVQRVSGLGDEVHVTATGGLRPKP